MKVYVITLLIAVLLGIANAIPSVRTGSWHSRALRESNKLHPASVLGESVLIQVQQHLATKAPVDEVLYLVDTIRAKLLKNKNSASNKHNTDQATCASDLRQLNITIRGYQSEIDDATTQIALLQQHITSKKDAIEKKKSDIASTEKQLEEKKAQLKQKNAEFDVDWTDLQKKINDTHSVIGAVTNVHGQVVGELKTKVESTSTPTAEEKESETETSVAPPGSGGTQSTPMRPGGAGGPAATTSTTTTSPLGALGSASSLVELARQLAPLGHSGSPRSQASIDAAAAAVARLQSQLVSTSTPTAAAVSFLQLGALKSTLANDGSTEDVDAVAALLEKLNDALGDVLAKYQHDLGQSKELWDQERVALEGEIAALEQLLSRQVEAKNELAQQLDDLNNDLEEQLARKPLNEQLLEAALKRRDALMLSCEAADKHYKQEKQGHLDALSVLDAVETMVRSKLGSMNKHLKEKVKNVSVLPATALAHMGASIATGAAEAPSTSTSTSTSTGGQGA